MENLFEIAMQLSNDIRERMTGRMAIEHNNAVYMACFAATHGDHLEIGTLHGGSAILVALLKKELGYKGRVTCIDPLNGYYIGDKKRGASVDPITGVEISVETIRENERIFGVDLEIVRSKSYPFPLTGRTFETAYIDGDHWGIMPLVDWCNVSQRTNKYIGFDNCDALHPDVLIAAEVAKTTWQEVFRNKILCVLEK